MNQIELSIEKNQLAPEEVEMLIAYLLDEGFESFEEDEIFLKAFCPEKSIKTDFRKLLNAYSKDRKLEINYTKKIIREKNWNEQWEKNFSPIEIENRVLIKAPFHRVPNLEFTVIIEPKMSFGTGHHETTRLMLREMMQADLTDKEVLDMGCGTGILAILASLKGAKNIMAIDIDEWAYENSIENVEKNKCSNISIFQGDAELIKNKLFDIILANINRNILLSDIKNYSRSLKDNGLLLLSGIYETDLEKIKEEAQKQNLVFKNFDSKNNWVAASFRKVN